MNGHLISSFLASSLASVYPAEGMGDKTQQE